MVIAILFSILGLVFDNAHAETLVGDDTAADFNLGSLSSCAYVSETGDGELRLSPAVGTEFNGSSIPAGWVDIPWIYQPGGSSLVSGGVASIDESLLATTTTYSPGMCWTSWRPFSRT